MASNIPALPPVFFSLNQALEKTFLLMHKICG